MNRHRRKIAFVSPHCPVDFTNGAATATLDALVFLQALGFHCEAFCNSRLDSWEEILVEEVLAKRGLRYTVRDSQIGAFRGRIIFTSYGKLPVTLFSSASTRGRWLNREEIAAFLSGCNIFLKKNRPDLVWTYGGDPVSRLLHRVVRALRIPLLFELHNFSYSDPSLFAPTDRVIVPTEFARQFYRERLDLDCQVLPLVVDLGRVQSGGGCQPAKDAGDWQSARRYVTFVNPEPRKGVHVFARIADVLWRRRPDIPLLLVEGAAKRSSLAGLGIDVSGLNNLTVWPNTPDVRNLYAASKLILMPSLIENAGCIAMEAMTNGIPVVASNRGGLPETIGDAALMIEIPARYTPETRDLPTEEEVLPWVETVIRLWDDAAEYGRWSQAARERAQAWHPDRLSPLYREFFSQIVHAAGQPPVQREGIIG
jgi:glycosyltransferase involved in cell wall biosynthesis